MSIAERLAQLRNGRGWTVQQASMFSGVSAAHISRLENGRRNPSPKTLRQLADGYGADFDELMALAGHIEAGAGATSPKTGTIGNEVAILLERLPRERQEWYRDILRLDVLNFNTSDEHPALAGAAICS